MCEDQVTALCEIRCWAGNITYFVWFKSAIPGEGRAYKLPTLSLWYRFRPVPRFLNYPRPTPTLSLYISMRKVHNHFSFMKNMMPPLFHGKGFPGEGDGEHLIWITQSNISVNGTIPVIDSAVLFVIRISRRKDNLPLYSEKKKWKNDQL